VHFDRARCLRRRCRCGIHRSATTAAVAAAAAAASSATATATTGLPVICLTYRPVEEGGGGEARTSRGRQVAGLS